jgi:hypothetical protein
LGSYPVLATITDANYQGSATGSLVISLDAPAARGTALVDFGPTPTTNAPTGIYWNNFTNADAGYALANLVATNNSSTGFGVSMTTVNSINTGWISAGDWVSNNATGLGLLNSQTAATDGFFVNQQQGKRGVKITGLDTNRTYNLGLFGTRNASETRSTTYTVRGASTNTGVLTNSGTGIGVGGANFNNNKVLSFSNVTPDATGAIVVEYQRLQGSFGYLNALSIQENGPVITATGSISALSTTYGTPSSPGSFTVSATSLLEGITVSAPSGYEVSTNNASGYAASITFGSAGTVGSQSVFVRLTANAPAGTHAGAVTVFSRGASTRIIPVATGTVSPAALGTVTFTPPASLSSDGSAKDFTATSPGVMAFTLVYSGRAGTTYGPSSSAPSLPGLYTLTATPDGNFTGSAQNDFAIVAPPVLRMHLVGPAIYNGTNTRVTHRFAGAANEALVFEYAEEPGGPFRGHTIGGYAATIQSDADGLFQLTIIEPGNRAAAWNSKMFFRVRRP